MTRISRFIVEIPINNPVVISEFGEDVMNVFLVISINGLCISRTLNPFTVMNSRNRIRL